MMSYQYQDMLIAKKLTILSLLCGNTTEMMAQKLSISRWNVTSTIRQLQDMGIKIQRLPGKDRSYKWWLKDTMVKAKKAINDSKRQFPVCDTCHRQMNEADRSMKHGKLTNTCRECNGDTPAKKAVRKQSIVLRETKLQHSGAPWFIIDHDLQGMYLRIEEDRMTGQKTGTGL